MLRRREKKDLDNFDALREELVTRYSRKYKWTNSRRDSGEKGDQKNKYMESFKKYMRLWGLGRDTVITEKG